eukprot:scaffold1722_cov120-Cylindrotheca_fusiformis.AAC.24
MNEPAYSICYQKIIPCYAGQLVIYRWPLCHRIGSVCFEKLEQTDCASSHKTCPKTACVFSKDASLRVVIPNDGVTLATYIFQILGVLGNRLGVPLIHTKRQGRLISHRPVQSLGKHKQVQ